MNSNQPKNARKYNYKECIHIKEEMKSTLNKRN